MSMSITEDVRVGETPRPANNLRGKTPLTPEELAKKEKARLEKLGRKTRDKGPDDESEDDE